MAELTPKHFIPMPDAVEPAFMKFIDLHAEPIETGKKIRIFIQITPFLESPVLEFTLKNSLNDEVCQVRIIEPVINRMAIVMHIRQSDPTGQYSILGNILYPNIGIVTSMEIKYFEVE